MKPLKHFQIGKKGLTDKFVGQLKNCFKAGENIAKIDILKAATRDKEKAKQFGERLIEGLGKNFTFKKIGYTLVIQKWRKAKR